MVAWPKSCRQFGIDDQDYDYISESLTAKIPKLASSDWIFTRFQNLFSLCPLFLFDDTPAQPIRGCSICPLCQYVNWFQFSVIDNPLLSETGIRRIVLQVCMYFLKLLSKSWFARPVPYSCFLASSIHGLDSRILWIDKSSTGAKCLSAYRNQSIFCAVY